MFIAIVESDPATRAQLASALQRAGHRVTDMAYVAALTRHLAAYPCDIIVVGSCEKPGEVEATIARLRAHRRLGIVALIDGQDHETRVAALENGADSCVTRPYDSREITACVESLARRMRDSPDRLAVRSEPAESVKPLDAWLLVSRKWLLLSPDGKQVKLTATECSLLSLLLAHAGKPVSRRDIVTALGYDYLHYDERRLQALVSRLRRKLGDHPEGTPIRVAHGFGYAFTASGLVS
ncbi:response regulator transcription factor [Paraburkholderia ferrariae]|uniref:response regulator transcription factor n=1 Tax=Paraburkholderia ferrariae TaxID=386056 RepID=UPI0004821585|nr:response regulator transcription factor [Paraburkholderia ferrariae]